MSNREREYRLFVQSGCQCTGTTKAGHPCRARVSCGACADFWAGVSDRCLYHIDDVEHRSMEIARIARRSGAGEVEALATSSRLLDAMIKRGWRSWLPGAAAGGGK